MDKKKMYRQVEKNEFGKFNSGASPTEPIVDEWRMLEKLVDIVKFEDRLKITYQLGNENIDFCHIGSKFWENPNYNNRE